MAKIVEADELHRRIECLEGKVARLTWHLDLLASFLRESLKGRSDIAAGARDKKICALQQETGEQQ